MSRRTSSLLVAILVYLAIRVALGFVLFVAAYLFSTSAPAAGLRACAPHLPAVAGARGVSLAPRGRFTSGPVAAASRLAAGHPAGPLQSSGKAIA